MVECLGHSPMGVILARISLCVCMAVGCAFNASAQDANNTSSEARSSALDPDFRRFVAEKRGLAKQLSEKHGDAVPQTVWDFFDAVQQGDWEATSNLFYKIEGGTARKSQNPWMPLSLWGAIHDTFGAYEQFHSWNPQMLHRFGETIIRKIPTGSIYFGGTDAGRFIISSLSASHTEGRPFFTVTQNALADGSYLDYLRDIYGAKIYVPTPADSQRIYQEYLGDVQQRREKNQLKEDEFVRVTDERVEVKGIAAVMAINEALVRFMIEKNPAREIYLEESYPLESLYRQSVPDGLIFKVKHEKMGELPRQVVGADHRFWTDECQSLIGNAVRERGSVKELCSWTERMVVDSKAGGFEGNWAFVKDKQAPEYWAGCRSAIAGYYEWWSKNSKEPQRAGFNEEADFAYRQAVALCPIDTAVVWRYTDFLLHNQRTNDAKVLVETTLRMEPEKRMSIDSDQLKRALKKLRAEAEKFSANSDKK